VSNGLLKLEHKIYGRQTRNFRYSCLVSCFCDTFVKKENIKGKCKKKAVKTKNRKFFCSHPLCPLCFRCVTCLLKLVLGTRFGQHL
jgi:hypothetical protein